MGRKVIKTLSRNSELDIIVQLVYDDVRDLNYVVKRVKHLDTPLYQTIFEKESQALMKLKACENVVYVFNCEAVPFKSGSVEGIISMEFIDGVPLSKKLELISSNSIRYQLVRQLINAYLS